MDCDINDVSVVRISFEGDSLVRFIMTGTSANYYCLSSYYNRHRLWVKLDLRKETGARYQHGEITKSVSISVETMHNLKLCGDLHCRRSWFDLKPVPELKVSEVDECMTCTSC